MSKLTLDEAIKHCEEVAEKNECKMTSDDGCTDVSMKQCAADHRQLAEWLTELLQRREWCAQYEVEQISNLEQYDMLSREYEILNERYKEAVRLLKLAICELGDAQDCDSCIADCSIGTDCTYKWHCSNEAEKLING